MMSNLESANTVEEGAVVSNAPEVEDIQEEVNPNDISKYRGEDGKIAGKFDSMEDLLASFNEAEEYRQKVNAEKARAGDAKVKAEAQANQESTIASVEQQISNEFMDGNPSEETIAKAKELGFSDEKIEVLGYRSKEALAGIVEYFGSKENFEARKEFVASSMSDQEKLDFNEMIKTKAGTELAMLGLEAKYNKMMNGNSEPKGRLKGSPASTSSVKPFANKNEMLNELSKVNKDRNNRALRASYDARNRVTPDSVIYG